MSERSELIFKLKNDTKFRASYIRSKLNLLIPSQLRGLRLKGKLTQKQLADEAEMKQPRISAMERPGEIKFALETLIRMAAAHGVGLVVKFVSLSEMLRWENQYSQDELHAIPIAEDEAFLNPSPPQPVNIAAGMESTNQLAGLKKEPQRIQDGGQEHTPNASAGLTSTLADAGGMR